MMKKNEKGFSMVEMLIVIVLVGLTGAVGWLVYDRQNNKKDTATPSVTQNTDDTAKKSELPAGFAKYSICNTGVTLAYPSSWGEAKQAPENTGGGCDVHGMILKVQKDNAVQVSRSFNAPSYCTYNPADGTWSKSGEYPPSSCEPTILTASGIKAYGFTKGALGAYGFTYGINLRGENFLLISDALVSDGTPEKDPGIYPSASESDALKAELAKNVEIIVTNNKSLFE